MWALEASSHSKPRPPAVLVTSLVSPAWEAGPCKTAGGQLAPARQATTKPPIPLSPRDFAVVTSRPTQPGCRKINPLRAGWKIRDDVLSLVPETVQSVNHFATAALGKPDMQCNDLIPNDCCYKYPYQDPLSRSSIL